MSLRPLVASAIASGAAIVAITAGLYLWVGSPTDLKTASLTTFGYGLFFMLFFGWLPAFVVTMCAYFVAGSVLKRSGRQVGWLLVILAGALTGAIGLPTASLLIWNGMDGIGQQAVIGACGGLVGGMAFWLVIRPARSRGVT